MYSKEEALKLALRELEGFARRNKERAQKAVEAARARADAERNFNLVEAESRYHEAHRIYLVIQARVQEALST